MIDQVLSIVCDSPRPYVPVLKLFAVDNAGLRLPGVMVTGVYGSDRGEVVVQPETGALDIMRFTGDHVDRVANVQAAVESGREVDFPAIVNDATVSLYNAAGHQVTRSDVFTKVRVGNPNEDPITVRLVYIVWDDPPAGRTQQADRTVPIGGLISIPAYDQTDVQVPPDAAGVIQRYAGVAATSLKAYPSV